MPEYLYFEDLKHGDRWVSPARTVTEADVMEFAKLTGDFDPLHVDEEFARQSPFGRPIAHGLLGLSFVAGLASNSPMVRTVAFLGVHDWRFLKPLYFDERVHVVTEVVQAISQGRKRGRVIWQRSLVNQRGEIIQEGQTETLVARRTPLPRGALTDSRDEVARITRVLAGGV